MDLQQYQQAVSDYAVELRGLFAIPKEAPRAEVTMRGSGGLAPDVLATRARQFVVSSQRVGGLTASLLAAAELNPREGAEIKLLAQAAAQVEVAQALLEAAAEQQTTTGGRTMRGGSTIMVQQSLNDLARVLEAPVGAGTGIVMKTTRDVFLPPKDLESARAALQTQVNSSVDYISRRAVQVGGLVLRDLLLMDGATVLSGVALVSSDLAQTIDKFLAGVGKAAIDLATSAVRLLLQAYDWIITLIGKDSESAARKQIGDWVDQLRAESRNGDSSGPFGMLVERIYVPTTIKDDVAKWTPASPAPLDKVNKASETVKGLADKYKAKTDQVEKLSKAIAFARKLPVLATPQGQALVAAVNIGLLGYVIYTGYDHVDSGRIVFFKRFNVNIPSRVEGVRKTVSTALGVIDQPAPGGTPPAAPSASPA